MRIRTNFLQKQRTAARQLVHLFAVGPKQMGGLEVGCRPLGGVGGGDAFELSGSLGALFDNEKSVGDLLHRRASHTPKDRCYLRDAQPHPTAGSTPTRRWRIPQRLHRSGPRGTCFPTRYAGKVGVMRSRTPIRPRPPAGDHGCSSDALCPATARLSCPGAVASRAQRAREGHFAVDASKRLGFERVHPQEVAVRCA
jgi:hypothetical protein